MFDVFDILVRSELVVEDHYKIELVIWLSRHFNSLWKRFQGDI